ncbi:LCCL domain-containing protein [Microthyrium microscopicum]|uniref:LCCL domain-containing protein n=1 Tax=Microthyrium microscopicum TaxID=703497 RepID=A0A6A6UR90_9PEZI|nr:LCCL domain-containing protein [Microthyrium microscopicum]
MRIDGEDLESTDAAFAPPWQIKSQVRRFPARVQRGWKVAMHWARGPQPARPWRITPIFEDVQTLPIKLLDRYCPNKRHKVFLLIAWYGLWLLTFSLVLKRSAFASEIPGFGPPNMISCAARFWGRGNTCGLHGDICRPFGGSSNEVPYPFRCPASCNKVQLTDPYPVGSQQINYRSLVVGGPMADSAGGYGDSVYRGDSFICGAAVHSGFLKNEQGGCGVLKLVGERSKYPSVKQHGINSIGFDSYFPQSFTFMKGSSAQCQDLRWPLLAVSVFFSTVLSLFTTSPGVFFWSIFTGLFIHVALVSDPPGHSNYKSLISTGSGRFLPAAFCAAIMYNVAVRHSLRGLRAQVEKTVLWLGACWVGSLNNYTFDKIPIQRLTPDDLKAQAGALPALFIIISVILTIALTQAWFIRIEGLMPKYLVVYGIFCGTLLLLLAVPELKIRIHHYILGLLFIPGTRLQMRPSLLYQGLLIGFFINGIARWGFDSLLQTPLELRGDAPLNSALPTILPPMIRIDPILQKPTNITFQWTFPPEDKQPDGDPYDGISIIVNEVERFKAYRDQGIDQWTWTRTREDLPEYFRFAYLQGGQTEDYTKAGTWTAEGGWIPMDRGPSG